MFDLTPQFLDNQSVRLHLPNSAFLGNFEAFVRQFDPRDPSALHVTANPKWISVHPAALAMAAALGQTVSAEHTTCDPLLATSAPYLERMGLFHFLKTRSGISINERDPTGRFIPLTQIRDGADLARFMTDMIPLLHLEPDQAEPIRYIVSELVRNVLEHSGCEHGATVAAQYHKRSNLIRIGIADTGMGVRKSITHSHAANDDLAAIRLALTPGITGTTRKEGGTDYNAGAGLFFTKSIATANRDFFVIYSGSALYKLLKSTAKRLRLHADPFEDRHTRLNDLPSWSGTVVGIDMSLDTANEAFSELLDQVRETYSEAIRARRAQTRRTPRFT